jgi:hypothetical protein
VRRYPANLSTPVATMIWPVESEQTNGIGLTVAAKWRRVHTYLLANSQGAQRIQINDRAARSDIKPIRSI